MEKRKNNKILLAIVGLLMIVCLLIPYPLNEKLLPKFFFNQDKVSNLSSLLLEEKSDSMVIQEKTKTTQKKKVAKKIPPQERKIVVECLPASDSIALPVSNPYNEELINAELQAWISESQTTKFKVVKKFYIPPVEYSFEPNRLILPLGLITVGTIASLTDNNKDFFNLPRPSGETEQHRYDDYLQYSIAPCLFVFDAIGDEKHNPIDQVFIMSIAYGLTALEVRNLKDWVNETRPDGGGSSFPSGHTAVAAVGAHMIYKEFKDTNPWIAYSGYAMTVAVGAGRIINNRHWACDVIAGAGFGILSTELAYIIYFPIRNLITNEANKALGKYLIVTPVINPGGLGLQVNYSF